MNLGLIASIVSAAVALAAFILSRIISRRARVRVHRASFVGGSGCGPEAYFVNVTNVSPSREIEVTHVWFQCSPEVHVLRSERPLPKRLKADEPWETWLPVSELPEGLKDDQIYNLARVRLSTGKIFRSKQNKRVPSIGHVPGSDPPQTPTGTLFHQPIHPEILSADWGIGEPNYKDKRELLEGYLEAQTPDLRASNQFFHDAYPNEAKHLLVRYRWPGTFAENERITFS